MELHIFAEHYRVIPLLLANQNQVILHVYDFKIELFVQQI